MVAERVPVDQLLDGLSAEERALWDRYLDLVQAAGPSEPAHTRTQFERPEQLAADVGRWLAEARAYFAKPAGER